MTRSLARDTRVRYGSHARRSQGQFVEVASEDGVADVEAPGRTSSDAPLEAGLPASPPSFAAPFS